jgi:hypothetical protein
LVWSPYRATTISPRTIMRAAATCRGVGLSPMSASENRMIHTSVSPENGARMLGLAKFIASTPHSGFKRVIPTVPSPLSRYAHALDSRQPPEARPGRPRGEEAEEEPPELLAAATEAPLAPAPAAAVRAAVPAEAAAAARTGSGSVSPPSELSRDTDSDRRCRSAPGDERGGRPSRGGGAVARLPVPSRAWRLVPAATSAPACAMPSPSSASPPSPSSSERGATTGETAL